MVLLAAGGLKPARMASCCYCPNFRSSYAKYSESPGPVLDHECGAPSLGCHVLCVSFITCLIKA